MDLSGKAAIVTGSSSGVGRATALMLARKGCAVLINYSRSREPAEAVCEQVKALGVRSLAVRADVSKDAECRAMVAAALDAFGRLDVLVNNAGTTRFIPFDDLDEVKDDDWDTIIGVNLRGPFQCARAARAALSANGSGCVVNVSSIAGFRPVGSSIPYGASKAALNHLTQSLARVMAPKVRVNGVAPGFIAGEWLQAGLGESYEAAKRAWEKRVPLQRASEPDDVARVILALIEGGDLVTGQVLPVEGGAMILS
jgi:3-oxoacyl-[acyl-carrier protein] reductase